MATETNQTQPEDKKTVLSDRQLKAIPKFVASSTYTEGCRRAKINKTTFYEWLKDPAFKSEMDRQRDQITGEAFALLSHTLTQAVEVLTGLLDDDDKRLRRMAAKDVVEYFVRHKEMADIETRLGAIEQKVKAR